MKYVICVYDDDWYTDEVEIICEEESVIQINYLHDKGTGKPVNSFLLAISMKNMLHN